MASLYLHPLAYLVGLEGVTLMKAFAGDYDRDVTLARLAETKRLLESADIWGDGVEIPLLETSDDYDGWAPHYDDPSNAFFAMDEAQLVPRLDRLPTGVAVDVACGTGRYAAHLADRGHMVHGFDTSPRMLALAKAKVPAAEFELADLTDLPLPDSSVDVVVNTLALTHLADLKPAFAEAARVLRPGGHLLISDVRGYYVGSDRTPLVQTTPSGQVGYIEAWSHPTSSYLTAALPVGFLVRACVEEVIDGDSPTEPLDPPVPPDLTQPPSIWDLHSWVPYAAYGVHGHRPWLIVWHFELVG